MKDALTRKIQASLSQMVDQLMGLLNAPAPEGPLYRVEQSMPGIHLLGFLAAQRLEERAYWRDREGECEIAAFGRCWWEKIACTRDIEPVFRRARELLESLQLIESLPEPDVCQCLSYLSFSDSPQSV
ncbi:MAG: hypothetical protein ACPG5T_02085, partial [Endozoicomonas sp.]